MHAVTTLICALAGLVLSVSFLILFIKLDGPSLAALAYSIAAVVSAKAIKGRLKQRPPPE